MAVCALNINPKLSLPSRHKSRAPSRVKRDRREPMDGHSSLQNVLP